MKILKRIGIALVVIAGLAYFAGWPYLKSQTKKISPEQTITYTENGFDISINYSSPQKKDRVIFGELVPYNQIWRTGANEPTSFTTKTNIKIIDKELAAGTYSIWTKPNKKEWTIYFNSEVPEWGVTLISGGKNTTRDPEKDVLSVTVPVKNTDTSLENFTITVSDKNYTVFSLEWDKTRVEVPISM